MWCFWCGVGEVGVVVEDVEPRGYVLSRCDIPGEVDMVHACEDCACSVPSRPLRGMSVEATGFDVDGPGADASIR